jgi:death-on-curing protein
MNRLTVEQVKALHAILISETGGAAGVRDIGLLESAVASPFQSFGNQYLYPSIQQKAAQLCYSLIKNHPFTDGNKRSGVHTMLVFLAANGIELRYTQQELIDFGLAVASGNIEYEKILQWVISHQE